MTEPRPSGEDAPVDEGEDLPFVVLTYRRTPVGTERVDAIPLDAEWHAHDVAVALADTGQPTWLVTLCKGEPTIERYRGTCCSMTDGCTDLGFCVNAPRPPQTGRPGVGSRAHQEGAATREGAAADRTGAEVSPRDTTGQTLPDAPRHGRTDR